jgi:hypothetical protein
MNTRRTWISWLLKVGPICCPETSVTKYHYPLRNDPEERGSQVEQYLLNLTVRATHKTAPQTVLHFDDQANLRHVRNSRVPDSPTARQPAGCICHGYRPHYVARCMPLVRTLTKKLGLQYNPYYFHLQGVAFMESSTTVPSLYIPEGTGFLRNKGALPQGRVKNTPCTVYCILTMSTAICFFFLNCEFLAMPYTLHVTARCT